MKHLVIAGDKTDMTLFSLIGAHAFEAKSDDDLAEVFEYCESEKDNLAGILINKNLENMEAKYYNKLYKLNLPMIALPKEDAQSASALDSLLEQTIGRKLEN